MDQTTIGVAILLAIVLVEVVLFWGLRRASNKAARFGLAIGVFLVTLVIGFGVTLVICLFAFGSSGGPYTGAVAAGVSMMSSIVGGLFIAMLTTLWVVPRVRPKQEDR